MYDPDTVFEVHGPQPVSLADVHRELDCLKQEYGVDYLDYEFRGRPRRNSELHARSSHLDIIFSWNGDATIEAYVTPRNDGPEGRNTHLSYDDLIKDFDRTDEFWIDYLNYDFGRLPI